MPTQLQTYAKAYYQEAIQQLQQWIHINSIHDDATISKNKPYGEGVYKALQFIGQLAEKDGFKVDYCEGHVTEITYGEGPIIGVYAHADVVPVAEGWTYPPFGGVIDQDKMYGRGTSDDKGPALAAYYALKLLKDHQLVNGFQVRLVIGGNEEKGSGCLKHYFDVLHKPYAVSGFTPDGNFPLIYGEKGISNFKISGSFRWQGVYTIKAGIVANSVIDEAVAIVDDHPLLKQALEKSGLRFTTTFVDQHVRVTMYGKAAHGSLPQLGINAGTALLNVLVSVFPHATMDVIAEQYLDYEGHGLGQFYQSSLLGKTTLNVGLISYQDDVFSLVSNYRYPENVDYQKVIKAIKALTPSPLTVESLMESKPLLMQPDSAMIQTLLNAYQEETGDVVTPMVTIGGGTYAKEAKNTVAFGSKFPHKEDHIHENDEKIDLEDFTSSIQIYARAIVDLGALHAVKK